MEKLPFKSTGHALAFYNNRNPARQRFINLLEPERFIKPDIADFSGDSPRDLWASICIAIAKTLRFVDRDRYWAFVWRNLGPRDKQRSVEDIAEELGRSPRTVRRYLRETWDDLESELVRRQLVPAPDPLIR